MIEAAETMARETRVRFGPVPDTLDGVTVAVGQNRLAGDAFLLRDAGLACLYRKGDGILAQIDDPQHKGSLDLFLAGSVHAAVAAINGLRPFHASAVLAGNSTDQGVIAFTGNAGAGKSTLAAALGLRGYPLFADDTLVMDDRQSPPVCLPGHKRLKLWPDSLALTGLEGGEQVSPEYPKRFVEGVPQASGQALPLWAIVQLVSGNEMKFEELRGAGRLAALVDDHYCTLYHDAVHGTAPGDRLARLARLAEAVRVFRFTRPLEPTKFGEMLDFAADTLSGIEP